MGPPGPGVFPQALSLILMLLLLPALCTGRLHIEKTTEFQYDVGVTASEVIEEINLLPREEQSHVIS
jgi:hypothetical protein